MGWSAWHACRGLEAAPEGLTPDRGKVDAAPTKPNGSAERLDPWRHRGPPAAAPAAIHAVAVPRPARPHRTPAKPEGSAPAALRPAEPSPNRDAPTAAAAGRRQGPDQASSPLEQPPC